MAINIATTTANKDETNATSYATASITMTANRLYLIGVANHGTTPSVPSLSGGGLTYTSLGNIGWNTIAAPNKRLSAWWVVPGSDTTTAITFSFGADTQEHCHWAVSEVTGFDPANKFGTPVIDATDSAVTSFTVTLAAMSPTGASWGYFATADNTTLTPGAGFTELSETSGTEGFTTTAASEWQLSTDNTVDMSKTGSNRWAGFAVEILAPTGRTLFQTTNPLRW